MIKKRHAKEIFLRTRVDTLKSTITPMKKVNLEVGGRAEGKIKIEVEIDGFVVWRIFSLGYGFFTQS